jgi:hypothetical protein
MLAVRVALIKEHGGKGKDIKFHLLIPTFETLIILRAFVFFEALFPLTIDASIGRGSQLVWLNIPDAPRAC